MELNEQQIERYSRHILLKDVGYEGQLKLAESRVLIIGAGGLGAPIALYLGAAGIGKLGIVDGDKVDISNLQRQIIHFTRDIDREKVVSAREKIVEMNPDVDVTTIHEFVRADNILDIIKDWDFIVDGTDSFNAKFLINDACVMAGKPFSHGGILRFDGQTMTINPGHSACYRCVFPTPPPPNAVPTCSQAGVLGAIAGMLGTIQATECLKFLVGLTDGLLYNRLLIFDARSMRFREARVKKSKRCAVCGENPSITTLVDGEEALCDLKPQVA